jgi:hypothetical protein
MTTIGHPMAQRAHGGAVAAMGHGQCGPPQDRIVGRIAQHQRIGGRGEFLRLHDPAGRRHDMDRKFGQRIEAVLQLCQRALLETGAEAHQHQRGGIVGAPRQVGGDRVLFVFQHRAGVAHQLPAGHGGIVEFRERRHDDAILSAPQLIELRQALEARMPAHAVEPRDHLAPHVELAENEGVAGHRGRAAEPLRLHQGRRKHRVDDDEIRRLRRHDCRHLGLDRGRGQVAGEAGQGTALRIAIDLGIGMGDLDRLESRRFDPRHHFRPSRERDRVAALGQHTGDAEARRQVPAARPIQP